MGGRGVWGEERGDERREESVWERKRAYWRREYEHGKEKGEYDRAGRRDAPARVDGRLPDNEHLLCC